MLDCLVCVEECLANENYAQIRTKFTHFVGFKNIEGEGPVLPKSPCLELEREAATICFLPERSCAIAIVDAVY